jgi:hypothetical protein
VLFRSMYFSAYLPNASHRKFCGDIPLTGPAIFVLDYAQPEMREMTADFRIVRDTGDQDADSESGATVAYLAPKRHPNGTLSLQHVFPEAGNFVAIVTLDGPNGEHWVSRFPFSVGGAWSARTPYYLLAAAAARLAAAFVGLGRCVPEMTRQNCRAEFLIRRTDPSSQSAATTGKSDATRPRRAHVDFSLRESRSPEPKTIVIVRACVV